jgi:hypothetical protein
MYFFAKLQINFHFSKKFIIQLLCLSRHFHLKIIWFWRLSKKVQKKMQRAENFSPVAFLDSPLYTGRVTETTRRAAMLAARQMQKVK